MDYGEQTINEFLDDVASETITPAGGSAAAIVGAIGSSLCEMACIHTLNKAGTSDREGQMSEAMEELGKHRSGLLNLATRDADVVDDVFGTANGEISQSAIKRSLGVPLSIAEACLTVMRLGSKAIERADRNVEADGWAGILLAHSALQAMLYTVRTNLQLPVDSAFKEEMERRTDSIEESAEMVVKRLPTR